MPWLNPTVILVALVLTITSAGTGYIYGRSNGKAVVQQQWDRQAKEHADAVAAYEAAARGQESQMQAAIAVLQRENKHARKTIADRDAALRERLRNRPDRDYHAKVSENPGTEQTTGGCTAAELFREDAEALVGEASRADNIRIELLSCYAAMDAVRNLYNPR